MSLVDLAGILWAAFCGLGAGLVRDWYWAAGLLTW